MNPLRSLLPRSESRYSFDDYVNWVNLAGFGGNPYGVGAGFSTTMPGERTEKIGNNFGAYVSEGLHANGIVWTCATVRLQVFSQARLTFQRMRSGRPGDLFIKVRVHPDERFRREGDDIVTTSRVPLPDALLGGRPAHSRSPDQDLELGCGRHCSHFQRAHRRCHLCPGGDSGRV